MSIIPHSSNQMAAKDGAFVALHELVENILKKDVNSPVSDCRLRFDKWNSKCQFPSKVLLKAVRACTEIVNKNPDVFDDRSLKNVYDILDGNQTDPAVICEALRMLKNALLMHEINRQNIMNAGVLEHLVPLLKHKSDEVGC